MVHIVNYGVGNLASIYNMLKKIGVEAKITQDSAELQSSSRIILPGIGAFDHCMQQFNASGLRPIVEEKALNSNIPVLGVCVGCQMLMEQSEEGKEKGLGWIKGKVVRFNKDKLPAEYKIPHMSWSDVQPTQGQPLYRDLDNPRFYFVHSYHIEAADPTLVTATAEYGYRFVASVGKQNIQGVQFHPEKSHRFGMKIYQNFANNF